MNAIAEKSIEELRQLHSACRHHVTKIASGLPWLIWKMIDFTGQQQAQIDAQAAQIKELQMDIIQLRQWQREEEADARDFIKTTVLTGKHPAGPSDGLVLGDWPITGKRVVAPEPFSPLAER